MKIACHSSLPRKRWAEARKPESQGLRGSSSQQICYL